MQSTHPTFNELIKNLKKDSSNYNSVNVALLGDFSSQHLAKALKAAAVEQKVFLNLWEADYDSIETNIYDESSDFYQRKYDYVLIFFSPFKLYRQFCNDSSRETFADRKIIDISVLISMVQSKTNSRVIVSNYIEYDDAVFGNFANKTSQSFLHQVRHLNVELMTLATAQKNIYIVDIQNLALLKGLGFTFDQKLYIHADLVCSLDFIALIAQQTTKIICAIQGSFIKCVILDLDNTLWGGIIGDDGIEKIQIGDLGIGKAYTNLQSWLLNLKRRGIILAVSSKNNEEVAKEAFIKHPGMTLRLEDISVFSANWETKVDNINFIQSILNISFDSIVFLDDNPFERDIVKQNIPGIIVPDLPEDPSEYLPYLQSLNLFETASLSSEDANRTKMYQEEADRALLKKTFTTENEFLESLNMKAEVSAFDNFNCSRVAQLSQRSNQFNLRTIRYTEEDVYQVMMDRKKHSVAVSMKDTYGDYGLISIVVLQKKGEDTLFIENWIMSCRVLKRGVERFMLNEIVNIAKDLGCSFIEGEYIPTKKNKLVEDHYENLGFEKADTNDHWKLVIEEYLPKKTFIKNHADYVIDEPDFN